MTWKLFKNKQTNKQTSIFKAWIHHTSFPTSFHSISKYTFSYFLFFCASIQAFIFFFFFLFKWGAHITHKSLFNRNLQNKTTQSAWKPNKKFTSRRDASFCPYLLFNGPPLFWCYNRKQNTSQGCTSLLIVLLFPFWTTASESETNMYLYTYI